MAATISKSRRPGFGGGADQCLRDLGPGDLPHRPDVALARRQHDQRLEQREVDLLLDVIARVLVGQQLDPVVLAPFGGQEPAHLAVGREHRRGGAELGAHVGDHVSVHRGQCGQARAVVLDEAPEAAVDVVPTQHLEDRVLRSPRPAVPRLDARPRSGASSRNTARRPSPARPPGRRLRSPASRATRPRSCASPNPSNVLPGAPNRCMCTGCETPFPGLENHSRRFSAERRNR
jgi:hypothetical protein